MSDSVDIFPLLERIAKALERFHPPLNNHPSLDANDAYVWEPVNMRFEPIDQVNVLDLSLLQGIEQQKSTLLANSLQFANGFAANNALLWGARGMGKSSLIKAIHKAVTDQGLPLKLIEIHREDIDSLPQCLQLIKGSDHRIILFCDDLSFEPDDASYKSLKAVL